MAALFRGKITAGPSLGICEELRTLFLHQIPFVSFVLRPESCSAVVKLNLKTQSLNPPHTCVCVCVVMRMYTACTAAKYHTFICYTLPFPVLKHRRPCVRRLKFFPVLAADFQNQPFLKKWWAFSTRLGHYAAGTTEQCRLGGSDG